VILDLCRAPEGTSGRIDDQILATIKQRKHLYSDEGSELLILRVESAVPTMRVKRELARITAKSRRALALPDVSEGRRGLV
jgi:hypothetical protein